VLWSHSNRHCVSDGQFATPRKGSTSLYMQLQLGYPRPAGLHPLPPREHHGKKGGAECATSRPAPPASRSAFSAKIITAPRWGSSMISPVRLGGRFAGLRLGLTDEDSVQCGTGAAISPARDARGLKRCQVPMRSAIGQTAARDPGRHQRPHSCRSRPASRLARPAA
jgi:hypothetical protein